MFHQHNSGVHRNEDGLQQQVHQWHLHSSTSWMLEVAQPWIIKQPGMLAQSSTSMRLPRLAIIRGDESSSWMACLTAADTAAQSKAWHKDPSQP